MIGENWPQGVKLEDHVDFVRLGDNSVFVDEFGVPKHCNYLWYLWEAWWAMHSADVDSFPGVSPCSCCLSPDPPLGSWISLSNVSEVKARSPKRITLQVPSTSCTSLFWLVSYLHCLVFSLFPCWEDYTLSWVLKQNLPGTHYIPCCLEVVSTVPTVLAMCFCCMSMMSC